VLAILLLHPNEVVSKERLALALWGDEVAGEAVKTVHVHMSRLRRALGDPALVTTTPAGYRLRVRQGERDVDVFEDLVGEGRAALAQGRFDIAAALLRDALSLWRGPPLSEFAHEPFATAEVARLEDRRLAAIENRVAADLKCGRHEALTSELRRLVVEHPTREPFVALLMLTLYRCGRQAEALDAYSQARRQLDHDLGILPGPALRRLHEAILRHDAELEPQQAPSGPGDQDEVRPGEHSGPTRCPFKGLAPFDLADAPYFCGRDGLVRRLTERLAGARLLGIIGPSGCGKSSLARAGLLPALAHADGIAEPSQVILRPGEHPARELAQALRVPHVTRVVVLVDQLEEMFTVCAREAERLSFVKSLVGAARDESGPFTFVITLRADFYGRCSAYPELAEMLASNHLLVGPMRSDELKEAIEGPARRAGLHLDSELTDVLLQDVDGQPGALPLLSATLLELWHRRDGRRLTRESYDRLGGRHGAIARLAEEAFERLSVEHQRMAQGVLLRLVDVGEDGSAERRRVALAEFEGLPGRAVASILALLIDSRLLTAGDGTVEIAHESLLREWPRLMTWIEHDREALRVRRSINVAAQEWLRVGRDDGALHRGAMLAADRAWEAERSEDLSPLERDFLSCSHALKERSIEVSRRRTRRLRALSGALAVLTVMVSTLAVLALGERDSAREREATATSLALASASASILPRRPDIALLLALEATNASPRVEARRSALSALTTAFAPGVTAILHGHTDDVTSVAFGPNGRMLASGSWDNSIRLWDPRTHRQLTRPLVGHTGRVADVAFSPDGRLLASASWDNTVRLWDPITGTALGPPLRGFADAVFTVAFCDGGRTLAAGGRSSTIRLWDSRTHKALAGLRVGRRHKVLDLACAPRGHTLAAAVNGGSIHLLDLRRGRRFSALDARRTAGALAFTRDGLTLASGSTDGTIRIWDRRTRRQLGAPLTAGSEAINDIALSPDGKTIAVADPGNQIRMWDVRTRRPLAEPLTGHTGAVLALAFSGPGDGLASAGDDHTVRLWSPRSERQFGARLRGPTANPTGLTFAPDGRTLATIDEQVIRSWNMRSHQQFKPVHDPNGAGPLTFDRDGRTLVLWAPGGQSSYWDVRANAKTHRPTDDELDLGGNSSLSPDGRTVAEGLGRKTITLRDTRTHKKLGAPLNGHTAGIFVVLFSPDGRMLASASADGSVRLWDVATRAQIGAPLAAKANMGSVLRFSPDGRTLATTGSEPFIRLWDIQTRKRLGSYFAGHPDADFVTSLAFSPDGQTLASAAGTDKVRLWDVPTGKPLAALAGDVGFVFEMAFSPNGRTVVVATQRGVYVWENLLWGSTDDLRSNVCKLVGTGMTDAEWSQFAAGITHRRSCR